MDSTNLAKINQDKAAQELASVQHLEKLAHVDNVADAVLGSTQSLIEYLDGNVTKTELVNQLDSISTPDVKYVVEALEVLDATLKTHENTDLSGVTALMQELVAQAQAIPKELPSIPEQQFVDYSDQFKSMVDAIQAVESVVKAQKLIAEAPIVNVPETNVNVDAPDLKPLQTSIKAVVKAVEKIVIPEFKTDNKAVEKLLKDANKTLQKLLEKPVSGGGGGSTSSWPALGTNGLPQPLNLDADGKLLVSSSGGSSSGLTDAELRATPVPVDIGSANVTLNASDIEIGAVEIKDGTTDNRTSVINTAPTTEYGLVTRNIPSGVQSVTSASSSAATVTSVTGATSATVLLTSNVNRLGAFFFNDSTANLYLKFGTGASTTSFTVKIGAAGYYEMPTNYTGAINGIWDAVNGSARITELT